MNTHLRWAPPTHQGEAHVGGRQAAYNPTACSGGRARGRSRRYERPAWRNGATGVRRRGFRRSTRSLAVGGGGRGPGGAGRHLVARGAARIHPWRWRAVAPLPELGCSVPRVQTAAACAVAVPVLSATSMTVPASRLLRAVRASHALRPPSGSRTHQVVLELGALYSHQAPDVGCQHRLDVLDTEAC